MKKAEKINFFSTLFPIFGKSLFTLLLLFEIDSTINIFRLKKKRFREIIPPFVTICGNVCFTHVKLLFVFFVLHLRYWEIYL